MFKNVLAKNQLQKQVRERLQQYINPMQFALPSSKAAAPFSKIPPAQLFSLRLSCTSLLWKCHLPLLDTPIFLSLEIPSSNRDTTFWNGAPCSKELPFSNGYLSSQAGLLFFPHFLMYRLPHTLLKQQKPELHSVSGLPLRNLPHKQNLLRISALLLKHPENSPVLSCSLLMAITTGHIHLYKALPLPLYVLVWHSLE